MEISKAIMLCKQQTVLFCSVPYQSSVWHPPKICELGPACNSVIIINILPVFILTNMLLHQRYKVSSVPITRKSWKVNPQTHFKVLYNIYEIILYIYTLSH